MCARPNEGTTLLKKDVGYLPDSNRSAASRIKFSPTIFACGFLLALMLTSAFLSSQRGGLEDARAGKYQRSQFFGFGINTGGSDSDIDCQNRTGVGWFGDSLEVSEVVH